MSSPPTSPARSVPGALVGGVVAALVAVGGVVLAWTRPWGDTGVAADLTFDTGRPVGQLVGASLATAAALVAVGLAIRRPADDATGRRLAQVAGVLVVAVAAVAFGAVLAVTTAQVFPRDGGWWAIVATAASGTSGLAVALTGWWRPGGRRSQRLTALVATLVPLALAVTGVVVAPQWPGHALDARYPASFAESPGPLTVTRVAWTEDSGPDSLSAVLGGRVVVAQDQRDGGDCRLRLRALDAGTGAPVWSVTRPLRCNGPRLAGLDGNNSVVRVTLSGGAADATGPATTLWVGTEDGRPLTPSADLDAVQWWTEGFGLVASGSQVRGLDARTGVTLWSRPLPLCDDGRAASLQLPGGLPAGTATSRTPYDSPDGVPGSVRAAQVGNQVVFAVTCPVASAVQYRAWFVDTVQGRDSDRIVTVGAAGAGSTPMTFVPSLDTVVALVPAGAPSELVHPATVSALEVSSGRVLWSRPAQPRTSIDVAPVDGAVTVSSPTGGGTGTTDTLDARTGEVTATRDGFATASVALTQARLEYESTAGLTVLDPRTGTRRIALPDCRADTTDGAAALLAGPGGVVVRCYGESGGGSRVVGLAP